MLLKRRLQLIVETITGKRCENCKYNKEGIVCLNAEHSKCVKSIFPIGFEKKEGAE